MTERAVETQPRLEGRNGDIWRMYYRGASQEKVAQHFSLSQERVSQIIREIRASIPEVDKGDYRRRHLELIAEVREELANLALDDPITALEHADRMSAMKLLNTYLEREAKMLGLDEAEKHDHTLTQVPLTPAVQERLEAARRTVAEREAGMRDGE